MGKLGTKVVERVGAAFYLGLPRGLPEVDDVIELERSSMDDVGLVHKQVNFG